jgi:hypothetical protein
MENNNLQQHYAIKVCVKLGEGAADTYEKILKAFGNDSVSHAHVIHFVNGREMVKDKTQCGCPIFMRTSTNVDSMRTFIHQDQHLTQDLNIGKVCAKMV